MRVFKTIGFWLVQSTWGFPQFILGLLAFLILFPFTEHFVYHGVIYTVKKGNWGGLSMSCFIFIDMPYSEHLSFKNFITHEIAHSYQSLVLGMFWLLIIGLPSLCWAGFIQDMVNKKRKKKGLSSLGYCSFFTEKNAEWIADKYFR